MIGNLGAPLRTPDDGQDDRRNDAQRLDLSQAEDVVIYAENPLAAGLGLENQNLE